jgi:zinc protease
VTDKEAGPAAILIRYPVLPFRERATIGGYREQLVESLFSGMLNQRLAELAQLPSPPFMAASSALVAPDAALPFLQCGRRPRRKRRAGGDRRAGAGKRKARAASASSAAELDRVKKTLMRTYERAWNERDKTDSGVYAAEYMRHFLEGESIPGIDERIPLRAANSSPASPSTTINAYARRTIPGDSGKLVVYTGPAKQDAGAIPDRQAVAGRGRQRRARRSESLRRREDRRGAPDGPVAGARENRGRDPRRGPGPDHGLTLSNGVKVILKPTALPQRPGADERRALRRPEPVRRAQDVFNARYADTIVVLDGPEGFLAARHAQDPGRQGRRRQRRPGQPHRRRVRHRRRHRRRDHAANGVAEVRRRAPRRGPVQILHRQADGTGAQPPAAQPGAQFGDTAGRPRCTATIRVPRAPCVPTTSRSIDLDRAIAIYRERFSSAKDLSFILVGSFDIAAIKPLLATYLGSLPTPGHPGRLPRPGRASGQGHHQA